MYWLYPTMQQNVSFVWHIKACVCCKYVWRHAVIQICPCGFPPCCAPPADSALPCPGCWPCGLAWASCCCARPLSTRPSSSTMWPGPAAPTSSPWVREPLCTDFGFTAQCLSARCCLWWGEQFSSLAVEKKQQHGCCIMSEWFATVWYSNMMIHRAHSLAKANANCASNCKLCALLIILYLFNHKHVVLLTYVYFHIHFGSLAELHTSVEIWIWKSSWDKECINVAFAAKKSWLHPEISWKTCYE